MERIIEKSQRKIMQTDTKFVRSIINDINWNARLIGLKGSRGVGKTTLLLQYIKLFLSSQLQQTLYISLDDIWFTKNSLADLADEFVKKGGKYLFIDEVHKYPGWSIEIKNIYDDFPELKIVFTGSSLLEILNARADLSRRAVIYNMQGLSFREYLELTTEIKLKQYSFDDILSSHIEISNEALKELKPLQYFSDYLKYGYYPFFKELPELYYSKLEEVLNMILEIELPLLRQVDLAYINKIKLLLLIISESVPFTPNVSSLAQKIGINRETLLNYLHYLNESKIISTLYKDSGGISKLQKPDKIFLENTNLMFALGQDTANIGNTRETFFVNQLKYKNKIQISQHTDFLVNQKYHFEIGGKNKKKKQISDIPDSFIVADNIEFGYLNKIPLWMFGLMY